MNQVPLLPLPLDQLPGPIQRFCDTAGPAPARMAAAKGLVPVKGGDLVVMLAQLATDPDAAVKSAANATLLGLPAAVMQAACDAALGPAVLHFLARTLRDEEAIGRIVTNPQAHDATVEEVARTCSERLSERIATNERRLLTAPAIIEALYKNRNTRMSTADRLIDLAARNHLELTGIPAFAAHVEALKGQLLPEPSDEPLPQDAAFQQTLENDADENIFEEDQVAGTEQVKQQYKPLNMQILDMTKAEKLRLALVGNMAARALLVRDHNKQIAMAAVSSPQMMVAEAAEIARSKEVSEEILRYIGNRKEWVKSAEVKHNLCFNPKTPIGISMRFISHLRMEELKGLAKNRNVSAQLKSMASQWVLRKEKKEG